MFTKYALPMHHNIYAKRKKKYAKVFTVQAVSECNKSRKALATRMSWHTVWPHATFTYVATVESQ